MGVRLGDANERAARAERVRRARAAQGLPPKSQDIAAYRAVAMLLRQGRAVAVASSVLPADDATGVAQSSRIPSPPKRPSAA